MRNDNTPLLKAFFESKWIRAILVIDVIAIILVVVLSIQKAARVSTITFNIAPIDAKISVNGDSHYANGQYTIAPGRYEIVVSRDGLETKTVSVDVESRHFVTVSLFLTGSDKNFDFYKQNANYKSFQKLKTITSASSGATIDNDDSAKDFVAEYDRVLSFFDKLPIKGYIHADPRINASSAGYAIRNGLNKSQCKTSSCLIVNYYGKGYESEVEKEIKQAGYNPKDYQIVYERYKK